MNLKDLQAICQLAIANLVGVTLTPTAIAAQFIDHLIDSLVNLIPRSFIHNTFVHQVSHNEYGVALLQTFILGTFFGIVAASVSATIARTRYRRSAWALVYSSAGALLFWLGAIGFAWQESHGANYPVFRALYGSGSKEHLVAVREASKVLTLLMLAPAIGASIGVLLTPKTLRKRKPKVILRAKGLE